MVDVGLRRLDVFCFCSIHKGCMVLERFIPPVDNFSMTNTFPSPADEEMADALSLDEWLITNREASFLLRVSGASMIDAGLLEGDMVILERGRQPKNGDIVVAEIDHEWTVKHYRKDGEQIILVPANKNYKPLIAEEELKIAGVVTAVVRKYAL